MTFDRKEWRREYYQKNKEKEKEQCKEYKENNKEKIKEQRKEYKKNNKKKIKEYSQSENGKKRHTISNWKRQGLIYDDYDKLYDKYITSEFCENCEIKFEEKIGKYHRCMDHDHTTGVFRNFLCNYCNLNRR
jgi:flagellar biosynthesis GTPase FlhF